MFSLEITLYLNKYATDIGDSQGRILSIVDCLIQTKPASSHIYVEANKQELNTNLRGAYLHQ